MFKKLLAIGAIALFTLTSTVFAASAAGPTTPGTGIIAQTTVAVAPATLSPEEAAGLQFMREEEKLAHDVYVTLYEKWNLAVFKSIAASEQQHTDAVVYLLERYDISDPAADNGLGEFTDPDLQALYDKLVAQGSKSIADALKVGGAIEEIDILDLQERLAATANADIQRVYKNLLAGSENHLRAFVTNLKAQTGETYAPQTMSQSAYDAIVAAANGRGNRGGGWFGRGSSNASGFSRSGGRRP